MKPTESEIVEAIKLLDRVKKQQRQLKDKFKRGEIHPILWAKFADSLNKTEIVLNAIIKL